MSPRNNRSLTASERAALAGLEANATAEDPPLARRLKGSSRFHPIDLTDRLRRSPIWRGRGWWGAPLTVIGLILVTLSLSTVWTLGLVGSLITTCGLWMVATAVQRRIANA